MKLSRALLVVTLLLSILPAYGMESLDTAHYESKIRLIFDDLLAMTSKGDQTDRVHEAIATTVEQLRFNRASKYLDPKENGLLSGMKFTYRRDNDQFGLGCHYVAPAECKSIFLLFRDRSSL